MSTSVSFATIAEYFRIGLLVGLLVPDEAISWADSEIAAAAVPPDGLIDLAWSKGMASTIDALSAVPGERNRQLAGRWLLGLLRQSVPDFEEGIHAATQRAMFIARHADLGDETYYRFDMIDDELSLARTKVYGSVDECRVNLLAELNEYQPVGVLRGA